MPHKKKNEGSKSNSHALVMQKKEKLSAIALEAKFELLQQEVKKIIRGHNDVYLSLFLYGINRFCLPEHYLANRIGDIILHRSSPLFQLIYGAAKPLLKRDIQASVKELLHGFEQKVREKHPEFQISELDLVKDWHHFLSAAPMEEIQDLAQGIAKNTFEFVDKPDLNANLGRAISTNILQRIMKIRHYYEIPMIICIQITALLLRKLLADLTNKLFPQGLFNSRITLPSNQPLHFRNSQQWQKPIAQLEEYIAKLNAMNITKITKLFRWGILFYEVFALLTQIASYNLHKEFFARLDLGYVLQGIITGEVSSFTIIFYNLFEPVLLTFLLTSAYSLAKNIYEDYQTKHLEKSLENRVQIFQNITSPLQNVSQWEIYPGESFDSSFFGFYVSKPHQSVKPYRMVEWFKNCLIKEGIPLISSNKNRITIPADIRVSERKKKIITEKFIAGISRLILLEENRRVLYTQYSELFKYVAQGFLFKQIYDKENQPNFKVKMSLRSLSSGERDFFSKELKKIFPEPAIKLSENKLSIINFMRLEQQDFDAALMQLASKFCTKDISFESSTHYSVLNNLSRGKGITRKLKKSEEEVLENNSSSEKDKYETPKPLRAEWSDTLIYDALAEEASEPKVFPVDMPSTSPCTFFGACTAKYPNDRVAKKHYAVLKRAKVTAKGEGIVPTSTLVKDPETREWFLAKYKLKVYGQQSDGDGRSYAKIMTTKVDGVKRKLLNFCVYIPHTHK